MLENHYCFNYHHTPGGTRVGNSDWHSRVTGEGGKEEALGDKTASNAQPAWGQCAGPEGPGSHSQTLIRLSV